jgi:hypothetical protein
VTRGRVDTGRAASGRVSGSSWFASDFEHYANAGERALRIAHDAPRGTPYPFDEHRRLVAPGLGNTWLQMSERGVFAFDSDASGGPLPASRHPGCASCYRCIA